MESWFVVAFAGIWKKEALWSAKCPSYQILDWYYGQLTQGISSLKVYRYFFLVSRRV